MTDDHDRRPVEVVGTKTLGVDEGVPGVVPSSGFLGLEPAWKAASRRQNGGDDPLGHGTVVDARCVAQGDPRRDVRYEPFDPGIERLHQLELAEATQVGHERSELSPEHDALHVVGYIGWFGGHDVQARRNHAEFIDERVGGHRHGPSDVHGWPRNSMTRSFHASTHSMFGM